MAPFETLPRTGLSRRWFMWLHIEHPPAPTIGGCPAIMRVELSQALQEALFELEVLPSDTEGALVGLYAVIDDLQQAIQRTEALDMAAGN